MIVALLSGVTDVDAITLATSKLASDQVIGASIGAMAVLLAGVSNTVTKGIITRVSGDREASKHVVTAFAAMAGALAAGYFGYTLFF
jgi:uncharacterized membrane protein (DUF4010 family)